MTLGDLAALHLALGMVCAVVVYRHAPEPGVRALASAAVAVPLWPLWLPFALRATPRASGTASRPEIDRIERALLDASASVAATALAGLLTRDAAARIRAEARHVAARLSEIDRLLDEQKAAGAARGDAPVAASDPAARAPAARLRDGCFERLRAQRDADARALGEVADLAEALQAELALARHAGASAEGVGSILTELRARLEGLGADAATGAPAAAPHNPISFAR